MRTTVNVAAGLALVLVLAGCGGSSTQQTSSTRPPATARQPAIQVSMQAGSSHPHAGRDWPVTITATRAGRPLDGTVSYAFLFGASVVDRRGPYRLRGGHYHDELTFPPRAAGIPLTFRAIVTTRYGTRHLDRHVVVAR